MEEENVVADNSQTAEDVAPEVTENVEETTEETVEEVKARLAKAEELANNYKIRAEKAEKKAKESVPTETKADTLSSRDILAITKANIADEDLDEVLDYAKFKKIPIAEALKSNTIKSILKDREEERKTAQATNVGSARRSAVKVSDEEIVSKSEQGQVPEDPEALARARWNLKKKK